MTENKRGGARSGSGNKTNKDRPLVRLNIKVHEDQKYFLDQHDKNSSKLVRDLLDKHMRKVIDKLGSKQKA